MFHHQLHKASAALGALLLLAACGSPAAQAPAASTAASTVPSAAAAASTAASTDLSAVKVYLTDSAQALKTETAALKTASDGYYALAQGVDFDYAALWSGKQAETKQVVEQARAAWLAASPAYERIEGIVAGVSSMADYDVILDAGSAAADDPSSAVPFDLKLPDGRTLEKPGNLFGLSEATLWGSRPEFTAQGVAADYNGNGTADFGEALPDANMLKATADELDRYTGELVTATQAWQPSDSDAFTALVVMIPTMNEYFESWKNSRFVAGDASNQSDFVVISRLADIQDILSGLQVVYKGISPQVQSVDTTQDQQIATGLESLKTFVADVHSQEQAGKRFSAEEADTLGGEAQNRATALAGQVSQVAAKLNIAIEQ